MEKTLTIDIASSRAGLSPEEIAAAEAAVRSLPLPPFAAYEPDSKAMRALGERYAGKKNIIIEGNGGSISTIRAYLSCFPETGKNVFLLDTDDPDCIADIKRSFPIADTLLIVTSKSGESINALADYLALREYETVFVTGDKGALHEISQKEDIPVLRHPEISGRFSGITECALFPAVILGMDIDGIVRGAREMYGKCAPDSPFSENPALALAAALDKLEKMDYTEVFLSIYSKKLSGFFELITQLIHESVCKGDKGQSLYGGEAPENQHHTLQRFNFGRKNSAGLFVTVEDFEHDFPVSVPENLRGIRCRNIELEQLGKMTLSGILRTEFEGTWKDTLEQGIPAIRLGLKDISPETAGAFVAFWHYAAFYSAVLRGVNPFDQPGVEKSKEYIFQLVAEK